MAAKLANAPVFYALAQARFNSIAAMPKYVVEIRDRLRREGYPLQQEQQLTQLLLPAAEPKVESRTRWIMTRGDRRAGYVLDDSGITFHTTWYETSEQFLPELLRGLDAVHAMVGLDHASRLGLRYLDAVLPRYNETVEQYLVKGVHGLDRVGIRRYALSESQFETDTAPLVSKGTLVARVLCLHGTLGFPADIVPPDLLPAGLAIDPRFEFPNPRPWAMIDTDHFVEGQLPIDMEGLGAQLKSLHTAVRAAFEAVTTRHAQQAWA